MKQWCIGLCVLVIMVVAVHSSATAATPILIAMRHVGQEDKTLPQLLLGEGTETQTQPKDKNMAMVSVSKQALTDLATIISAQQAQPQDRGRFLSFETFMIVQVGKKPVGNFISDKTFAKVIEVIAADYLKASKPIPEAIANYQKLIKNAPLPQKPESN